MINIKELINKAFDWYYEENIAHTNIDNEEATELFVDTELFKNMLKANGVKSKNETALNLDRVMPRFSPNYKREKHPLVMRLLGIWRIITCRNFILIDFKETTTDGEPSRKVRPLYRSDYDAESEFLTLKAALHMKSVNGV